MSYQNFDCDNCRMPSPSVEIPIDVPKEIQTEQGMMLTTYLLMALSIESLQDRNNRLENENDRLHEQIKEIYAAYINVIEKYEQSEEAIMDDYSGTTSYDRGMQSIKQECNELRHRFDDTLVALGIETPE